MSLSSGHCQGGRGHTKELKDDSSPQTHPWVCNCGGFSAGLRKGDNPPSWFQGPEFCAWMGMRCGSGADVVRMRARMNMQ